MESANMGHQHQLQEQLGGSSSLAVPSFNGVGIGHFCNQNISLNGGRFNSNLNGTSLNTRDLKRNSDILVHPSINTSMFQDLGFHWSGMENYSNYEANEVQFAKLKGESSDSYPKFCDPSILEEQLHLPSTRNIKQEQQYIQDLNEKLFLKNFSSGYQINGLNLSSSDFYSTLQSSSFGSSATPGRGNFSRVHPSSNISSLNSPSSSISSSLDMNLQSSDLFASTKVGANFSQPLLNNLSSFKAVPLGFDHLQDSSQGPANSCQMTSFMNGAIETKGGLDASETKPCQPPPKKPRFESRSLPPIKVRKEKLGDRIAALQQLVAPFGKTDTASVLLEAIGYIKFLQDQVETLSVPYMKNNNGSCTTSQQSLGEQESKEEPKRDLRSRGLCLVPLSCTSYVTNDNGSVWSPPNYRGGT